MTRSPEGSAPSILNKSYKIGAELTIPAAGAEGVLVTQGGRFNGWGLYVLAGKPVFHYNTTKASFVTRWRDLTRFRRATTSPSSRILPTTAAAWASRVERSYSSTAQQVSRRRPHRANYLFPHLRR